MRATRSLCQKLPLSITDIVQPIKGQPHEAIPLKLLVSNEIAKTPSFNVSIDFWIIQ